MPQLAPLSWIVLSFFLFFVTFSFFSSIWWMKKSPLVLGAGSGFSLKGHSWAW